MEPKPTAGLVLPDRHLSAVQDRKSSLNSDLEFLIPVFNFSNFISSTIILSSKFLCIILYLCLKRPHFQKKMLLKVSKVILKVTWAWPFNRFWLVDFQSLFFSILSPHLEDLGSFLCHFDHFLIEKVLFLYILRPFLIK